MLKFYNCGQDFLQENKDILVAYPLETLFFEVNAKFLTETNKNDFLVKIADGDKFLLAVHNQNYPMVIFGNMELCGEFAQFTFVQQLTFGKTLGSKDICEKFFAEYEKLAGGTHAVNHAMDIMRCDKILTQDVDEVETPTEKDADGLAKLIVDFTAEALGDDVNFDEVKRDVLGRLPSFAVIKNDGKIVSLASVKRETDKLASLADVYTLPQYRCMGLSCKVVTYITQKILDSGRLPYLFVDKTNPISNHLYTKIGYTYATPQYEFLLIK